MRCVSRGQVECGEALRSWMATGHDRSELFVTTKAGARIAET